MGDERVAILGSNGRVKAVATLAIPLAEIEQAVQIIDSGGTVVDQGLPKLGFGSYDGVKIIRYQDKLTSPWLVKPDPAPAPAENLIEATLEIQPGLGRITGLDMSSGNSAAAIVASEPKSFVQTAPATQKKPVRFHLDRYDVAAGKPLGELDLTYPASLLSTSPSGKLVAVLYKTGNDRIDIYSLDDKSHVLGWRPYKSKYNNDTYPVKTARFVDEDHLLTMSNAGNLVLWNIPNRKSIYVIKHIKRFDFSPGGRYLAVMVNKMIYFHDALTGSLAGSLKLDSYNLDAFGFHRQGDKMAVSFMSGFNYKEANLGIVDLKTGKMGPTFPVPASLKKLEWQGDNHILADNRKLIDLKNRSVVWNYFLTRGVHSLNSLDGRHWYVSQDDGCSLNAVHLPDQSTQAYLANKDIAAKTVLDSGMKVSLSFHLQNISDHPNLAAELRKIWTERLRQKGITVAPGQKIVLFATTSLSSTGKSQEFAITRSNSPFVFPNIKKGSVIRKVTINQTNLKCRIGFSINNRVYANQEDDNYNYTQGFFPVQGILRKNETASQHLNRRQSESAALFFRSYVPPGVIFEPSSHKGFGTSQLTTGGVRPLTN
ncbi:MAG: hypothetical protein Tsb009_36550 [Planctomycetaceae bacterium]